MVLQLQLYMFAVMMLCGVAVATLYDFYRTMRFVFRWRRLAGELADILFLLVAAALVLAGFVIGTWGVVRSYTILGVLAGVWFYLAVASPFIQPVMRRLFQAYLSVWLGIAAVGRSVMGRGARGITKGTRFVRAVLSRLAALWPLRKPPKEDA